MRRYLKITLSMLLCVALITSTIKPAFAATTAKYISDIRISYGNTDEEARQWLIDNGYTPVKQNVNLNAADGLSKKKVVYIGYKTTFNSEQAITDIALMDMKGGYSFSDYQEMLKKQYATFEGIAKSQMKVIKEFRTRYKEGSPTALMAYKSLNNYREDDSGKLVGDYFLDENLSVDKLVKFVTQISQCTLQQLNDILGCGVADYNTDSFLTKLSKLTKSEKESIMSDDHNYDNAYKLLTAAETLGSQIKLALSIDSDLTNEEKSAGDGVAAVMFDYLSVYEQLRGYSYGNGTIADLFMKSGLTVVDLYPLASVMTQGQIEAVAMANFDVLMRSTDITDTQYWDKAYAQLPDDAMKTDKVVSAYFGVDRSMFSDSVAVTSEAMREIASTGDTSPLYGNMASGTEIALLVTAGATALTSAICGIRLGVTLSKIKKLANPYMLTAKYTNPFNTAKVFSKLKAFKANSLVNMNEAGNLFKVSKLTGVEKATYTRALGTGVASVVFWAAMGISLIISAVFMILEVVNYYNPDYTKTPTIMLDLTDKNDTSVYIRYNGVLDSEGKMGDLNGYVGQQWNAIYYTKDKSAGHPLLASTLAFTDKTISDKKYKPIHYFGQENAVNLNIHTFNNSANAIYIYFKQDTSIPVVGSVFSGTGAYAMTAFGGAVVGFVITLLFTQLKKKKKDTTPEAV